MDKGTFSLALLFIILKSLRHFFFFRDFNKLNQLYDLTAVQLTLIPILAEEMKKFYSLSWVNYAC